MIEVELKFALPVEVRSSLQARLDALPSLLLSKDHILPPTSIQTEKLV